jgi:hypothetical protein
MKVLMQSKGDLIFPEAIHLGYASYLENITERVVENANAFYKLEERLPSRPAIPVVQSLDW